VAEAAALTGDATVAARATTDRFAPPRKKTAKTPAASVLV